MAVISLDQVARLTELGKTTITRAINCRWVSARRKKDGIYEIDPVEPASPKRLHALMPWSAARLADLRADEELRRRVARRRSSPSGTRLIDQPWKIVSIVRREWTAAGHSI